MLQVRNCAEINKVYNAAFASNAMSGCNCFFVFRLQCHFFFRKSQFEPGEKTTFRKDTVQYGFYFCYKVKQSGAIPLVQLS